MAQATDTDQMRTRIEQQRAGISHTVDQIGNRVTPSHIMARRQDRMRRRLTIWRDNVFGNDEPDFAPPRTNWYGAEQSDSEPGVRERMGDAASDAASTAQEAPETVRRQTRGNPLAAGAIALGAGWLIGSLLPESGAERRAVQRVEPQLKQAASEVQDEAQGLADDLREPAKEAATQVKETGADAAQEVKEQGRQSAERTKQAT